MASIFREFLKTRDCWCRNSSLWTRPNFERDESNFSTFPKHPKIVHCTEMAKKLANSEMVNMLSADLMARLWRNASTLTSSLPLAPHICVFVVKVDPPQFHQLHLMWCKSFFNLGDTLVLGYPKQAGYSLCDCIAKGLKASSLVSNRLQ